MNRKPIKIPGNNIINDNYCVSLFEWNGGYNIYVSKYSKQWHEFKDRIHNYTILVAQDYSSNIVEAYIIFYKYKLIYEHCYS